MLQLKNVHKNLGDFQLKNINLEVEDSEYCVILGATGTGKTLILETIAGMYRPDSGEIWFRDQKLNDLYPEEREVGFVYQDYALFPHLNLEENIIFGLKLRKFSKIEIDQRLNKMVKMLEIEHLLKRYPATLSGGEQQRAAIARALITSPKILLLDEPLSSLDPRTKEVFQQELKKIHRILKPTVIHITHDFDVALSLADKIVIMHDGKVIQAGSPNEIFYQPQSTLVANFVGIKNIFSGKSDGHKVNICPNVDIDLIDVKTGNVTLVVRPEAIIVSKKHFDSSARNQFKGKLVDIVNQRFSSKVTINIGIPFISLLTTQSVKDMGLKKGDEVWLTFKSSAVHVF